MEKCYCLDLRIPPHRWPGFVGHGKGTSRAAPHGAAASRPASLATDSHRGGGSTPALLDLFPAQPRRHAAASRFCGPFEPVLRLSRLRTTWTLSTRHSGDADFRTFTQSAPWCCGACTVKPPTALNTSEQKPSPRRAGVSMIGYDNTPRKEANDCTLGCAGIRLPWSNSRSTATQPLTPHLSWLPIQASFLG